MRATVSLFAVFMIMGLFLWISLSGALFWLGLSIWFVGLVISIAYRDTLILYLLGAREVRASDESLFYEAAAQEAYKLSLRTPQLYYYNGMIERAFVLQGRKTISLVVSKELLHLCTAVEMRAICFELLLQAKKGMASKRTKAMYLLALFIWPAHSIFGGLIALVPFKELRNVFSWFINYLLNPFVDFVFKLVLGKRYFRKLDRYLSHFPQEKELLSQVGLKLRRPEFYYSTPSRKLLELTAVNKSHHYQSILALEFLPHEWDYLFLSEELKRAE